MQLLASERTLSLRNCAKPAKVEMLLCERKSTSTSLNLSGTSSTSVMNLSTTLILFGSAAALGVSRSTLEKRTRCSATGLRRFKGEAAAADVAACGAFLPQAGLGCPLLGNCEVYIPRDIYAVGRCNHLTPLPCQIQPAAAPDPTKCCPGQTFPCPFSNFWREGLLRGRRERHAA